MKSLTEGVKIFFGATKMAGRKWLLSLAIRSQSKDIGGIGVRNLKVTNQALRVKMGCCLIYKIEALWVKVLRSKCAMEDGIILYKLKGGTASALWRGIRSVWQYVIQGTCWSVGDGARVKLWLDA